MPSKPTTALIDGDVFAYRVAAKAETVIELPDGTALFDADLDEAKSTLDDMLGDLQDRVGASRSRVAITDGRCFRYGVLPTYKHNRREVRKPILLRSLKEHLIEKWGAQTKPRLEADDVLGIWATWSGIKGKKVIVSIDKDFKQIPGWFFNPMQDETAVLISVEQADHWHFMQTLMGDVTDGYKGCPGIGPKKAQALLKVAFPDPAQGEDLVSVIRAKQWEAIVGAYVAKGLTEDDALQQARVARICRASDYDFDNKEPILWTPR